MSLCGSDKSIRHPLYILVKHVNSHKDLFTVSVIHKQATHRVNPVRVRLMRFGTDAVRNRTAHSLGMAPVVLSSQGL